MITGLQLKLARVALGLEQRELGQLAGLQHTTISKLENSGLASMPGTAATFLKLTAALASCGATFGADGLSVGLRDPRLPWPGPRGIKTPIHAVHERSIPAGARDNAASAML